MKILKKLFLPLSLFCFLIAFSSCNKEDNEIEFVGFGTVENYGTVINIDVKEGEEPLYLRGTMLNSMLLSDGQRVFVYGTIDKDNQTEDNKAMLTNFIMINPFPTLSLNSASSVFQSEQFLTVYEPWVTYNDAGNDIITIHCEALLENNENFTYFVKASQAAPYNEGDSELNINFMLEIESEVNEGYRSPIFRSIELPFGANNNPGKPINIKIKCNTQSAPDCLNFDSVNDIITITYNRGK